MNKEITLEDYLQNSGTRSSEPISAYEHRSCSIKTIEFKRRKDGLYEKIETKYPQIIEMNYKSTL